MADYIQTKGGLIVPTSFAEPQRENGMPPPDFREVATTRDGRDITRGFVDAMQQLLPMDSVLALRGNYNYSLYREVLRDDQVKATFDQRRLAVTQKEWKVFPGGDRPIDIEAAEFLEDQLSPSKINFDNVTEKTMYGIFYGYSVGEVLYRQSRSRVFSDIRIRDRTRFVYDGNMQLRLMTMFNMFPGELLGDRKFWVFVAGADHDDEPYGLGLAHWLYWPVFFKRGGIKLWLTFLDKFGAPTAKGEYHNNATPEEKQKLLAALEAITSESGIIVPEGMAIELLEAARSGSASYTDLYDRMDRAIAKVNVGQVGSTEGTPGQLGNQDTQESVLDSYVKADADSICGSFNRTVVKWMIDYNFPGAAYPEVWRIFDEDLNRVVERDNKLNNMGWRPTEQRVRAIYGEGYERVQLTQRPAPGTPEFAEATERARQIDELRQRDTTPDIDQMEDEAAVLAEKRWERVMGGRVRQLIALAEDSGDLVTFRERLSELASAPPDKTMLEEFRNVGVMGRLWGRWRAGRGFGR